MTTQEHDRLLDLAAKVRRRNGEATALAVLTAGGIAAPFAREKLRGLASPKRSNTAAPPNLAKLLVKRRRNQCSPRKKTCFIIAPFGPTSGRTKAQEGEVVYLREKIVREALKGLPYQPVWADRYGTGANAANAALTAIGEAQLVVAVLSPAHLRTYHQLGMAQACGKPVLSLAVEGTKLPAGVGRAQAVFYCGYSPRSGIAALVREKVISQLRARACALEAQPPRRDKRLLEFRSCTLLEGIYTGKEYALRQFWLDLSKVAEEMDHDYELVAEGRAEALEAIARLAKNSAEAFSEQSACLHEALRAAISELPRAQYDGCSKVCEAMSTVAEDSRLWVDKLLRGVAKTVDISKTRGDLEKMARRIVECRDLLLEQKMRLRARL